MHLKSRPLPPRLLLEFEPAYRVFLGNLAASLVVRPQGKRPSSASQVPFWSDMFVTEALPWRSWLNSGLLHLALLGILWGHARLWTPHPRLTRSSILSKLDVVYFSPNEPLPPLNTINPSTHISRKGDPEHARQPIISLPQESENSWQRLITPPKIQLDHDLPMPNLVAWAKPAPLIAWPTSIQSRPMTLPIELIAAPPLISDAVERRSLSSDAAVIAPPPEIGFISSRPRRSAPQPAVVAPPPSLELEAHAGGEINIGPSTVVEPSPDLPVPAQRPVVAGGPAVAVVVPPPPEVRSSVDTRPANGLISAGPIVPPPPGIAYVGPLPGPPHRLIALSLRPATAPRPEIAGNRRGTFTAVPEGRSGAAGTPNELAHGNSDRAGLGEGRERADFSAELPSGIFIGRGGKNVSEIGRGGGGSLEALANPSWSHPSRALTVNARRVPPPSERGRLGASELTPLERQVFGQRRSYSMVLNMPNLNSSLGSWILHFAELKPSPTEPGGELIPPQATHKVDPGYPLELMRENVKGTLSLYAVIHSDGTVGDVRVLRSPDDRLDSYALMALSHWHFRPAQKNGNPVALEAVVMIAFRPSHLF